MQSASAGYRLHEEEIRRFAELAAGMLGDDLASRQGEDRIRACHALLERYPYAYPFALELSLRLPSAVAITWLRKLRETFYAREDVQDEIDAFQIWRMAPLQALTTALRHVSSGGRILPSVLAYLEERRPLLARCLRRREARDAAGAGARLARVLLAPLARACSAPGMPLRGPLLRFYLRHDVAAAGSSWRRLAAGGLALLMLARSEAADGDARLRAARLPVIEESCAGAQPEGKPGLDLATVLWGRDYVLRWAELNAPSLLAPGNLPALAAEMPVRLVFYTTREDMERIRNLSAYRRLRQLASVRFVLMERLLRETAPELLGMRFADKYAPMTAAHNHCMRRAAAEGRYVFFNFPDMIWQEDFLSKIAGLIREGKTHILYYPGPYLVYETAEKEIRSRVREGILAMSNKDVRALCAAHRHPSTLLYYEDAPLRYFGAIMRMYRNGNAGDVIHMACFVPLVIRPDRQTSVRATIDADHPLSPFLAPEEVALLTDNASLCAASLDPLEAQDNAMRWPPYSSEGFARDFRAGMRLWNRIFFAQTCRFHGAGVAGDAVWSEACEAARRDAEAIQSRGSESVPPPPAELFIKGARAFLQETSGGNSRRAEREACTK